MKIVDATLEDRLDFILLAKAFIKESKYPFSLDKDMLYNNYELALQNEGFKLILAKDEDEAVGMLVGAVNSTLFSSDSIAVELAWFLYKDYRGGPTALKMLKMYEDWARGMGCKFATMVDIHQLENLGPLYERKGYTLTEKTYVKEL